MKKEDYLKLLLSIETNDLDDIPHDSTIKLIRKSVDDIHYRKM